MSELRSSFATVFSILMDILRRPYVYLPLALAISIPTSLHLIRLFLGDPSDDGSPLDHVPSNALDTEGERTYFLLNGEKVYKDDLQKCRKSCKTTQFL